MRKLLGLADEARTAGCYTVLAFGVRLARPCPLCPSIVVSEAILLCVINSMPACGYFKEASGCACTPPPWHRTAVPPGKAITLAVRFVHMSVISPCPRLSFPLALCLQTCVLGLAML